MEADGVPQFIKQCTQIIEEKGLKMEGIYRVSGKKDVCLELQDKYDMGGCFSVYFDAVYPLCVYDAKC